MDIKEKIKKTGLFQNIEKVELLASIDSFTPESIATLSNVIDEYDESIKEIRYQFKEEIETKIESLKDKAEDQRSKEALHNILTGYTKILS